MRLWSWRDLIQVLALLFTVIWGKLLSPSDPVSSSLNEDSNMYLTESQGNWLSMNWPASSPYYQLVNLPEISLHSDTSRWASSPGELHTNFSPWGSNLQKYHSQSCLSNFIPPYFLSTPCMSPTHQISTFPSWFNFLPLSLHHISFILPFSPFSHPRS